MKKYFTPKGISSICIFFIMCLLLLHSTYLLFKPNNSGVDFSSIDVVLRTTLSSIFGFSISRMSREKVVIKEIEKVQTNVEAKIFHISLISIICVYCIIIILVCRTHDNLLVVSPSSIATITQYRDFISSGIGALIGLSQSKS